MESLFPAEISENEFFSDLYKAKSLVDHGIKDYFILLESTCFREIKEIGNTTLKDCVDIFGLSYVTFFRFAGFFDCKDAVKDGENYQSFSIRPATKSDKSQLRGKLRYFPKDTWICDWRSGDGSRLLLPFVQNPKTAEISFIAYDSAYNPNYNKKADDGARPAPVYYMKSFIEVLPDYYTCNLAICKYKGVDMAIPIAAGTAKRTFKNRDKDESGKKRHIVHTVKSFNRVNSESTVERHLRGGSDITIKGEKITISTPLEWCDKRNLVRVLANKGNSKYVVDIAGITNLGGA